MNVRRRIVLLPLRQRWDFKRSPAVSAKTSYAETPAPTS